MISIQLESYIKEWTLIKTKGFICSFFGPLIISIGLAFWLGYQANLQWVCPTRESLAFTMDFFKVPLYILSLIFPFVAMAVSHHRYVQTREQITLTREQNVLTNYYKHREEFHLHIKEIVGFNLPEEKMSAIHKERQSKLPAPYLWSLELHRKLYPAALNEKLMINQSMVDDVKKFASLAIVSLEDLIKNPSSAELCENIAINHMYSICEIFGMPNRLKNNVGFSTAKQKYEYAKNIHETIRITFDIIAFDKMGDMQINDSSLRERVSRSAKDCIKKYHTEVTGDNLLR